MQHNLYKNHFQKIFGFILLCAILSGSFFIGGAQTNLQVNEMPADRDRRYAQMFRLGRGSDFAQLLTKSVGATELESIQDWLDTNNAGFFRAFDTAFQNETGRVLEQKIEKNKPLSLKTTPKPIAPKKIVPRQRKSVGGRRALLGNSTDVFFQNASYNPASGNLFNQTSEDSFSEPHAADDVAITKIETDDGFQMKSSTAEKTKIVGDTTITQGATGETRMIGSEGASIGSEYKAVEFVEAFNKKERTGVRTETTISWRVLTASCPDADGISKGSATMTTAVKKTITTPQTIGILTRDVTTRMTIKGFVNDSAELTHFDLEGATVETISGYERAERLGLIENVEYADGTKQINYQVKNNKPGKAVVNEYGFTTNGGGEMGEIKATTSWEVSEAEAQRIEKVSALNLIWIYEQAVMHLEAAQTNWRYYGCVGIEMSAPKTSLRSAEKTEVSAETVHKFDKSKVNAELILKAATDSATPEKQSAATQAKFDLTAPKKGAAQIIVESISRRGIGLEILDFAEEKTPKKPQPTQTKTPTAKKCGAWSGKITAVKRKRTAKTKPADGRLIREIDNREETFSIDYHVLGIQDTTKNFANGYFADAQMNYRATEYRESNYAEDKMMCGNQTISTTLTQKFESLMTALSSKRITVYVSLGEKGILTFGSPEVNAERVITRTYESGCESYNRVNSGADRDERLIAVPNPSFEIRFDLDANSRDRLVGRKTIEESDGTQTIVTWNLTRDCP